MKYAIDRVLVIGLGLIGGSFARALRSRGIVREVVGYDRNADEAALGVKLGVIDRSADDLAQAVGEADLVMLAVPVKVMEAVLAAVEPHLKPHTLLTDVGSTKANLVTAARSIFSVIPPTFVPGHPIAGAEKSGVRASDADLFERHKVILTPLPETDSHATLQIARLWQSIGAEVLQMDVDRHDQVLAATSHLPHMLAFSLVDTLAHEEENTDIFRYAAGGFRDFTRIAASDPVMWHDVCLANRDALLKQMDQFTNGLARLRQAIVAGDSQSLLGIFTRAKVAREHFTRILSGSAYAQVLSQQAIDLRVQGAAQLRGEITLPGDLSISHRAIMLGALAEGITDIEGFREGEDSLATLQAFRDMGVVIEGPHQGQVRIYGVGLHGLQPPPGPLYLGNSATSMRLLAGLLSAQTFATELFGDESLSQTSMASVIEPLRQMGANIQAVASLPPLKIEPSEKLIGIRYEMPQPSAQVKSSLLLAGLYATGKTEVSGQHVTRDHTERMLQGFGYTVDRQAHQVSLGGGESLQATQLRVPGDPSSALFFIIAATMTPGSELQLPYMGVNPTRMAALNALELMGAALSYNNATETRGEAVADICVRSARLQGVTISEELLYGMLDDLPLLMVAAMRAEGQTRFELPDECAERLHERLHPMVALMIDQGVAVTYTRRELLVSPGCFRGGEIRGVADPRIALACVLAGLSATEEIRIINCASVLSVFPDFVEQAQRIGVQIHKEAD
ncbi:bifunctional prephenate dehydrogenase/3-phosphoshikimate 1-carboxyvinyltransferase [Nitrincola alkalilacustris]|uniref:bifunctional prephenate dehydrogenase/3-phosphoshikimate 1-carboxyvinyltransferase n=1 Tax=Nitrincola alkalilacustris TaxID=1571224 RepID=UPI00124F5709|nr:bifunctional prephenate dehydrogenase/3-phosphoshikimate 1-carboxyvinyltransferase [Nitrincola alkalilacustris]